MPLVASAALVCAAPLSCGAASLAAGAAFYGFMLSKMYEEYLEDCVYRLMAKIASRICRMIKFKNRNTNNDLILKSNSDESNAQENLMVLKSDNHETLSGPDDKKDRMDLTDSEQNCETNEDERDIIKDEIDEDLNNLNFHLMLFFMWLTVTVVNVPALLTWARNFKYSMVLKPDTSYHTGLVMSACSTCVWQMNGPRKNLKYYEAVTSLIFTMAVFILVLGPLSLTIVNYGVTLMFLVITIQQIFDKEENVLTKVGDESANHSRQKESESDEKKNNVEGKEPNLPEEKDTKGDEEASNTNVPTDDCDVCSESRIYSIFRNLREKFSFNNEEL